MNCSYVTGLIHMWHDSFICDMTHSLMNLGYWSHCHAFWRSFVCVTWLICKWHDSRTHVLTPSNMRHFSSIYGTWLLNTQPRLLRVICVCDMTHSHVTRLTHTWHDTIKYVTWLIHIWHLTTDHNVTYSTCHSCVWHDLFARNTSHSHVTWRHQTCDMTHPYM